MQCLCGEGVGEGSQRELRDHILPFCSPGAPSGSGPFWLPSVASLCHLQMHHCLLPQHLTLRIGHSSPVALDHRVIFARHWKPTLASFPDHVFTILLSPKGMQTLLGPSIHATQGHSEKLILALSVWPLGNPGLLQGT